MFHQNQTQDVVVNYGIHTVFNAILKGVDGLSGFKIKNSNRVTHTITVNVGMSMFSWGEEMSISLIELSEGKTQVNFSSGSKLGTEFAANSKNRKNIDQLMDAMARCL